MRSFIKDVSQIMLALLITGSMVYANELPKPIEHSSVEVTETQIEVPEEPVEAPAPKEKEVVVKPEPVPEPVVVEPEPVAPPPFNKSDSYADWMNAAKIPQGSWSYVDYIITNESGWDPCAYYPGQSDCNADPVGLEVACGLVQQYPCGKIAGDWRDPVAALVWADSYVKNKYGDWAGAYNFWLANGHY